MNLEKLVITLEVADKAFKAGIGAAIGSVTALVGVAGLATKATFTWAAELDSIQDIIGGTNEEAAALNFTLRKSGTDADTFTKSLVIFNKGLVKSDGTLDTIGQSMANWGIDVKDANGNLKPQSQLIDDISKKYNSFSTQQEKVNFLTEVFGKGGAEMIDFFDTLAAEGGVDEVTQKVKDFGLVIDPARYENFTRSLEEMKLIGLGLAVKFTEKLMPVFEDLLTWVNSFRGLSLGDALDKLSTDFLKLGANFEGWADSIDWAKLSADLITKIQNIDWATLGQTVRTGFKSIFDGLSIIINEVDWKGLFNVVGIAFLDFMAGLTGQKDWDNVKATWSANLEQLKQIVNTIFTQIKTTWSANFTQLKQIVNSALLIMKTWFTQTLNNIKSTVISVFAVIRNTIYNAISGAVNSALGSLNGLIDLINSLVGMLDVIALISSAASGGGTTANIQGHASGGYPTGLTWVGEHGPELVNLPSGSYVNNAVSSRSMANQPMKAYIDYDELARTMGRVLGQQMQRTP